VISTLPQRKIRVTTKELARLHEDVEDWKIGYEALADDCWIWENLIGRANEAYKSFQKLVASIETEAISGAIEYTEALDAAMTKAYKLWSEVALEMRPQVERLVGIYGNVDGAEELLANFDEGKAIVEAREISESLIPAHDMAALSHGNPRPECYGR